MIHGLQVCGPPDTGPALIDGHLDCATEASWVMQGSLDPSIPGLTSPEDAIYKALDPYEQDHGGDIELVSETVGSLVVEQREQVVARVSEVSAGGWVMSTLLGCDAIPMP